MTAWFANLSIRSRFVLPIAAMMLVFAAFITFFFPSRQRAASEEALENKARSITQMVAYSVAAGLEFGDQVSVLQVFNWARTDEDLAYIVVRDTEGKPFASYPADGEYPFEDSGIRRDFESTKSENTLQIVGPVRRGENIIGSIQLGLSTERINAQYRSSWFTALLFSLAVGSFGFAITVVVGRQVAAPILDLTKTAEEIASLDMKQLAEEAKVMASGDLTGEVVVNPRQIQIETGGEIGRMAKAFNLMVDQLAEISKAFNLVSAGLRDMVVHVQASADEVATGSDSVARATGKAARGNESTVAAVEGITSTLHEMNANIQNVARNAQSQSASTTETLASIENMLRSVQTVAGTAERLVTIASRASNAVTEGGSAMEAASQGMSEIREVIRSSAGFVQDLGGMAEDIGTIVGVIDEVAEQIEPPRSQRRDRGGASRRARPRVCRRRRRGSQARRAEREIDRRDFRSGAPNPIASRQGRREHGEVDDDRRARDRAHRTTSIESRQHRKLGVGSISVLCGNWQSDSRTVGRHATDRASHVTTRRAHPRDQRGDRAAIEWHRASRGFHRADSSDGATKRRKLLRACGVFGGALAASRAHA